MNSFARSVLKFVSLTLVSVGSTTALAGGSEKVLSANSNATYTIPNVENMSAVELSGILNKVSFSTFLPSPLLDSGSCSISLIELIPIKDRFIAHNNFNCVIDSRAKSDDSLTVEKMDELAIEVSLRAKVDFQISKIRRYPSVRVGN